MKLTPSITLAQFENGYWYATELKTLAQSIGIPSAGKLRKDELEKAVKIYLTTGKIESPTKRSLQSSGAKDVERGLSPDLPVAFYLNGKVTNDFLDREARKIAPGLKRRSGTRYRLNRWREEQLTKGVPITYGDLVQEHVRLNQSTEPFASVPHARYINFLSEFMATGKGASREAALKAWHELKGLNIPKDYRSWAKFKVSSK
jgi:SAP domain-containing new25